MALFYLELTRANVNGQREEDQVLYKQQISHFHVSSSKSISFALEDLPAASGHGVT